MVIRSALVSSLTSILISRHGAAAWRCIQAILFLSLAQFALSVSAIAAGEAATTVKLDGKTVFITEIHLTRRVVPVNSFIFIGAWEDKNRNRVDQKPLCAFDLKSNSLIIKSPEKLLRGSKTRLVNRDNVTSFLNSISWGGRQATHFAFKVISGRRQPAVIELFTDSDAVLFNNGDMASHVSAASVVDSGGRGYLPLMLREGENIINIKQFSTGQPCIHATIFLDNSHDLQAAQQTQGGLLKRLVHVSRGRTNVPELDWNPYLRDFTVSFEVRDVFTNSILHRKESARRGRILDDRAAIFEPGIYEIIYRARDWSASEFFIVGSPNDIFVELREKLSRHNPCAESKLNIEAQLRRAQILLRESNHDSSDRQWQEKIAYTFSRLATIERRLKEGVTNIAKDQPGLHIRSFASKVDGSPQFYRLFVPSTYNPGTPLPLLVCVPARIGNLTRAFIEGRVMANHREALLWAKYAEKHEVAVLWPGYRGRPEGYPCESAHIDETIQAVEKDYAVDKHRISVYATCAAGYNAGRLVSEYDNRFAGLVYDRAVFNLTLAEGRYPSSVIEWLETTNPIPRVLGNRNLRIFVMHDDTRPDGHGEMELTTQFLDQAKGKRDDIVTHLSKQPMTEASRIDKVFSWLAQCRNENPNGNRSRFMAKAGYIGPILEVFATPAILAVGSHASNDRDQESIQRTAEALAENYERHFHGAKCAIKIDDDVTEDNIINHSLILIGNPQSNSVWQKLQPRISLTVTPEKVSYKNTALSERHAFQAIVRNPDAADRFVLMIGASDLQNLQQVAMDDIFRAWYDCIIFSTPRVTIGRLENLRNAQSSNNSKPTVNRKLQTVNSTTP